MRPKKRILLVDSKEDRKGELRFVLEVCGYRVIEHARGEIAAIVAHWPIAQGTAAKLKKNNPDTPLVVLVPVADEFPLCTSADLMLWDSKSRVEFLARLRILTARKRGPKKGFKHGFPKVVEGLLAESRQGKGPASHGAVRNSLEQSKAVRDGAAA